MRNLLILLLICVSTQLIARDSLLWEQKANMEAIARHRCSAFTIGDKGYVGLGHYNSVVNVAHADFWRYDIATNSWTQIPDFPPGPRYYCYEFVIGENAYVGAGRDVAGVRYNDHWEYSAVTNQWTQKTNFPGSVRAGCKGFTINGIGYAGIGTAQGASDDNAMFAYHPTTDTWSPIATFPGTKREAFSVFTINNLGYVTCGENGNQGLNDIWEYNPTTDIWTQKADAGPIGRMAPIAFSLNGKGYIMTGAISDWLLDLGDCWEYDPILDTTIQIPDFEGTKRHFATVFTAQGKAFLNSGTSGINFNDNWKFDPRFKSYNQAHINYDPSITYNNSKSEVFITLNEKHLNKKLTLKIIDARGIQVDILVFKGKTVNFNKNNLAAGIYFYIIEDSNERIQDGRFVFE